MNRNDKIRLLKGIEAGKVKASDLAEADNYTVWVCERGLCTKQNSGEIRNLNEIPEGKKTIIVEIIK